jgi:hypothetical protein
MAILLPCLIASAVFVLLTLLLPQLRPTATEPAIATTNNLWATKEDSAGPLPSSRFRVEFASGPGVTVLGWPSKGGIYVLSPCFGVELDFLELDRFHNTERPSKSNADSKSDEEAHCDRSE